MFRYMIAALALATAMLAAPQAVIAQTHSERIQAHASWSRELGVFAQEAITFIDRAAPAYQITIAMVEGSVSREDSLAQLDAWRNQVDAEMDVYRSRGAVLAEGPRYMLEGQGEAVALMRELPAQVIATAEGFLATVEQQARDAANGEEIDPYLVEAAQLALLQDYYAGLMTINGAASDGLANNHPQHGLLSSMTVNMESIILGLEIARQRMGGPASRYAVEDYAGEIAANQREVEAHIAAARQYYTATGAELDAARGQVTGNEARQVALAIQMFSTYPASFEAELYGSRISQRALAEVTPVTAPEQYGAWLSELAAYEAQRDNPQLERQRLASQF